MKKTVYPHRCRKIFVENVGSHFVVDGIDEKYAERNKPANVIAHSREGIGQI